MNRAREVSPPDRVENFSFVAAKERWLDFLALEHEVLPLPAGFAREGEDFLVRRAEPPGRRISAGRIPAESGAALFLQAAAVISFLQASGFWLDEEDLTEAVWDLEEGTPRLWLTRTPASVGRGGPGPAPSAVLAAFLHRIFARTRRIQDPAARSLFDRLLSSDAAPRRAEFWLASAYRLFPSLALPGRAAARARTLGYAGSFLRSPARRALIAKGRALLTNRVPRIFASSSRLTAGGALGLEEIPAGAAEASRRLRERHEREAKGGRALWIAVEPDRWDRLSRRAFETARRALQDEVEAIEIPSTLPPPLLPDEWRREIFVPCGTLSASLRFYEAFSAPAREVPEAGRRLATEIISSPAWAAYASDPTGDAPVPVPEGRAPASRADAAHPPAQERQLRDLLSIVERPVTVDELARALPRRSISKTLAGLRACGWADRDSFGRWRLTPAGATGAPAPGSRRRELARLWARVEEDVGRRIELLLSAGESEAALEEGERWFRASPEKPPETWFELSARLGRAAADAAPGWLEALEAEREIAGGRLEEAEARLARFEEEGRSSPQERRSATLRRAEVRALRGDLAAAGREAAAWRRAYPAAPARDRVRALRVEAASSAREGDHESALRLLDEADRLDGERTSSERIETALARASVYSLQGRFREEKETYDQWRPALLRDGDDALTARFLAREALGLVDRREFAAGAARLEEARAVLQDDPVERAKVTIDFAATLYHAGRPDSCEALLEEAVSLASLAGREDLARTARGNRLELLINRGEWAVAAGEVEALASAARRDRDGPRLLVALHHGSRLALRRGDLDSAARDNQEARGLATRLCDRLEIGELWLEEGDRLLYLGDLEEARRAYELAAADPPDRCDSDRRARERLREFAWREEGGPPASAREALAELFSRDEYAAAETAARWHVLFRGEGKEGPLDPQLRERAERTLRSRGGEALADRVFGRSAPAGFVSSGALRALRDAAARALAGEEVRAPLETLGLSGLLLSDSQGREILRLGRQEGDRFVRRRLESGSVLYELALWPVPPEETASAVALLLETLFFRASPPAAPSEHSEGWRRVGIVAADVSMEEPYRRLCRFAAQPVTVLVLGESGTGKEAAARAVHSLSARASGPFVTVNVAAIPGALLESELFGHARGAFTGAERDRRGLLEEAQRGTLFFDEIGDLSPPLQAKLLRVLQEREVRRVGESQTRRVDVRVVSATSRDLAREVEAGRFREDLYYRLHVAVIALPPLRERGRDVLLLARHFLERYARDYGRGSLSFAPEVLAALPAHSWPGNVRELQNAVSQAVALADVDGVLSLSLLPASARRGRPAGGAGGDYRSRVDAHRRGLIADALERSGGNRSRAARDLGLSRQALLYLIRELNVPSRSRASH